MFLSYWEQRWFKPPLRGVEGQNGHFALFSQTLTHYLPKRAKNIFRHFEGFTWGTVPLKIFYLFRKSKCLVNGFLTNDIIIKRGVRQGCPLSMLLFIIAQEPLYAAIERSTVIRPFRTPNCDIKLQGYADDSNIILADDQSIIEALKLVKLFETATGA